MSLAKMEAMTTEEEKLLLHWPEVKQAIKESRCELVLTNLLDRKPNVDDEKLQAAIFRKDTPLNFVELSVMKLSVLHPSISNAVHLTNLVLHTNLLKEVPSELGELKKLKLLDLSRNQIEKLPESLGTLSHLVTFNLANNKISSLPSLRGLVSLQLLDVSHNALTEFPSTLPSESPKIQTLLLNSNQISTVPSEVEAISEQLKTINLSANNITELPLQLAHLPKLKVLDLTENKFVDKRFGKLAADKRHTASSLLDYLKKKAPAPSKGSKKTWTGHSQGDAEEGPSNGPVVKIHFGSNTVSVKRLAEVAEIRPNIACCMVRNLQLDHEKLRLILAIQNKLHDSLCGQRTLASFGTHDCRKFRPPLLYTALEPEVLMITPLHRHTALSGRDLVTALTTEAELLRKQRKRNTFSSIHKYLHLVRNLSLYPCLIDADGLVISFAPVTNCEGTKLSVDTSDILVEVTSNESQLLCRQVLDSFIEEIIKNNLSSDLIIEQIKVYQHNGELLSAYPGKLDLQQLTVLVKRELIKGSEPDTVNAQEEESAA